MKSFYILAAVLVALSLSACGGNSGGISPVPVVVAPVGGLPGVRAVQ